MSPRSSRIALAVVLALTIGPAPAFAWIATATGSNASGDETLRAAVELADGDLLVVGEHAGSGGHAFARRLAGATGLVRWEKSLRDPDAHPDNSFPFLPRALALGPDGEAWIAGWALALDDGILLVLRLAADTGELVDLTAAPGYFAYPQGDEDLVARLVVSADTGQAFVLANGFDGGLWVVVATDLRGVETWSWTFRSDPSSPRVSGRLATDLVVGSTGDVYVAGRAVYGWPATRDPRGQIVRLDAATGAERWRLEVPEVGTIVEGLATSGRGDLFAAGDAGVAAIDPVTGSWHWLVAMPAHDLAARHDSVAALDASVVRRFRATDGAVAWEWEASSIPGLVELTGIDDEGGALLAVSGRVVDENGSSGVALVWLDAASGDLVDVATHFEGGAAGDPLEPRWTLPPHRPRDPRPLLLGDGDALLFGSIDTATTRIDAVALRGAPASAGFRWKHRIDEVSHGDDVARDVEIDGSGDVWVAGILSHSRADRTPAVLKLSGVDGSELHRLEDAESSETNDWRSVAIETSPAGAAFASTGCQFCRDILSSVRKLDGPDGQVLWERDLAATDASLRGPRTAIVRADRHGDVFTAAARPYSVGIEKISGVDGRALWESSARLRYFERVELLPGGDVVAITTGLGGARLERRRNDSGDLSWSRNAFVSLPHGVPVEPILLSGVYAYGVTEIAVHPSGDLFVNDVDSIHRFSGGDGTSRWAALSPSFSGTPCRLQALAVDGERDLVAVGSVRIAEPEGEGKVSMCAARLDADDGHVLWAVEVEVEPTPGTEFSGRASRVAVDGRGQVFVGGSLVDETARAQLAVVALDEESGELRWSRTAGRSGRPSTEYTNGEVLDLGVAPNGDVVAAGKIWADEGLFDLAVVRWNGIDGSDLVARDDHKCRSRLARLSTRFYLRRDAALSSCRSAAAAASGEGAPDSCREDELVRTAVAAAAERFLRRAHKACGGELPAGIACDTQLAALTDASGSSGCLSEPHRDLAAAAVESRFGAAGLLPNELLACQQAIAAAGEAYIRSGARAWDRCVLRLRRSTSTARIGACHQRALASPHLVRAGMRLNATIAASCTDVAIASLGLCGADLESLVTADGVSGCLVEQHRAVLEEMQGLHFLVGPGAP
jgi:outer membrane protein assembly factor BamB